MSFVLHSFLQSWPPFGQGARCLHESNVRVSAYIDHLLPQSQHQTLRCGELRLLTIRSESNFVPGATYLKHDPHNLCHLILLGR